MLPFSLVDDLNEMCNGAKTYKVYFFVKHLFLKSEIVN